MTPLCVQIFCANTTASIPFHIYSTVRLIINSTGDIVSCSTGPH